MDSHRFDYIVIGSGIGGLTTAALLANAGYKVGVIERHYSPGGYGHSFTKGGYTFCAQLHYLWNCNEGDDFDRILKKLGIQDEIQFSNLDQDGFDRLRFPSFSFDICAGFARNAEMLSQRFPDHRNSIRRYFEILTRINSELLAMPLGFGPKPFLLSPWKYWNLIRYRNWTTEDLFNQLDFPLELRSILAGQSGDLLVPPSEAALFAQAGLSCGYDTGACVPTFGYEHLFSKLVDVIQSKPGCAVFLKTWIKHLEIKEGKIHRAVSVKGTVFEADQFLYNGDPKKLSGLVNQPNPRWFESKLDYEYSLSCFTLYLGIKGLDLTKLGFGNWNLWHYAHDDINECYRQQTERDCLEDPTLFISTPTLHHKKARIAPEGCEQMVVCTPCRYSYFKKFQELGRAAYLEEKQRVTNIILDTLERHYLPGLRNHIDFLEAGSPTTNERFTLSPQGNAYGAKLTPGYLNIGKIDYRSPYPNLWLVGATAGIPSFAGGVHFARLLYEKLTGDRSV